MVSSAASINPFTQAALARQAATQAVGSTADTFAAELSAALRQALQQMGVNPAAVQVTTQAKGQDTATSAGSGQFIVTVDSPATSGSDSDTSTSGSAAAADTASSTGDAKTPYRTDIGTYNPLQYATDATAHDLAASLGATMVKTSANTGPFSVPPQNMLDFGNGFVANAGLVEQFYNAFGSTVASKMLRDQANLVIGASGSAQNPSLSA